MTDHNPILPEDARIVRIKDTEYVAIHKYWWDKEKKRGQQKRRYIGKLVDGKFVPNAAYAAELKLTVSKRPLISVRNLIMTKRSEQPHSLLKQQKPRV